MDKDKESEKSELNKKYRLLVDHELNLRKMVNPKYSVRSFARATDIDPSLLSKFLRNQRNLNHTHINRINKVLSLPPILERKSEVISQKISKTEILKFPRWYFFATLELFSLTKYRVDATWVSNKLNIPLLTAKKIIQVLIAEKMLAVDGGVVKPKTKRLMHIHRAPHENTETNTWKNFQVDILRHAIFSRENLKVQDRAMSTVYVASSPDKIDEARRMIARFRKELILFMEDTDKKTDVYQFTFLDLNITAPHKNKIN